MDVCSVFVKDKTTAVLWIKPKDKPINVVFERSYKAMIKVIEYLHENKKLNSFEDILFAGYGYTVHLAAVIAQHIVGLTSNREHVKPKLILGNLWKSCNYSFFSIYIAGLEPRRKKELD